MFLLGRAKSDYYDLSALQDHKNTFKLKDCIYKPYTKACAGQLIKVLEEGGFALMKAY